MQLHLFIYLKQAAVEPLSHYYDHNVYVYIHVQDDERVFKHHF